MKREQAVQALYEIAREIDFLENTIMTLSWDMRVNLPRDSGEYRGNTIGFLSSQAYERKTSARLNEVLCVLEENPAEDDEVLSAMVRKFRRDYTRLKDVPADLNAAYAAHKLRTEIIWQTAKAADDYEMLRPWMEQEFEYLRQISAAHGYADDPLTGLMAAGEPGLTREKTDLLFEELKTFELPFLEKLKASPYQPEPIRLSGPFPFDRQKEFCTEVLGIVGFDFNRGRMDVSAHPYTTANDPDDVRFTTRFSSESFVPALMSCMHEGGHGMHWQNCRRELRYTTLESAPFDAICESQSRYMENIIGYSPAFWEFCLPIAQRYFPQLSGLSARQLYEALNCLHFDASRMKADELTYNLHIIIRYELEKQLFDRSISFAELPAAWNEKYREYLGVTPCSNAEGVLQDMHWSSGYIGYFQSYVMGNFYDGHYYASMKKDVPDFYDQVRSGKFTAVTGWLRERIQQYGGMYLPSELLSRLDGEELSARHYIDYIRVKYSELYQI